MKKICQPVQCFAVLISFSALLAGIGHKAIADARAEQASAIAAQKEVVETKLDAIKQDLSEIKAYFKITPRETPQQHDAAPASYL